MLRYPRQIGSLVCSVVSYCHDPVTFVLNPPFSEWSSRSPTPKEVVDVPRDFFYNLSHELSTLAEMSFCARNTGFEIARGNFLFARQNISISYQARLPFMVDRNVIQKDGKLENIHGLYSDRG